jgi:hypothetical protein
MQKLLGTQMRQFFGSELASSVEANSKPKIIFFLAVSIESTLHGAKPGCKEFCAVLYMEPMSQLAPTAT